MTQVRVGPLVRATSATSATVWVELAQPCSLLLQALPMSGSQEVASTASMKTVTVGGRYFAIPQLQDLQPATWYTYRLLASVQGEDEWQEASLLQCFRTLDEVATEQDASLRLVYGSCRKLSGPDVGVLGPFGSWLLSHFEQRESIWPRLLLLIGDQIYADQPAEALVREHPRLASGATSFEDFALSYEYAWTRDENVRQTLAVLPSYMIFDDHEILNDWNIAPQWCKKLIDSGREQVLIDGLVAYWIYQGWGNLVKRGDAKHPLVEILREAERSGDDAFAALHTAVKASVYGEVALPWHYTIATSPAIFVANARADRTAVFSDDELLICAPARIMDRTQMHELGEWMQRDQPCSILVSSVPLLLPPLIGFAEYFMGVRPWQYSVASLRRLGVRLARVQMLLALKTSFDHWPTFSATWQEFIQFLDQRQHDLLVLSGDVHFSYAMQARRSLDTVKANLYQFVSTPMQNALSRRDATLILGQSFVKRLTYGGLITRILPMRNQRKIREIRRDLLFRNTLAVLDVHVDAEGRYHLQQDYLGVVDGQIEVIGSTEV